MLAVVFIIMSGLYLQLTWSMQSGPLLWLGLSTSGTFGANASQKVKSIFRRLYCSTAFSQAPILGPGL